MQLAEENARVTRVKYQQGVGSNLEVTTAENDLTQAQNNYYNSLYDLVISQIDLQLAKGTLKP
jgi:outer membrane protein TolC